MSALTHEFTCSLSATPERVFAALTQPAELRQWFAEHAEIEPRVGGAYRFWGKHTYGTPTRAQATQAIRQIEPGRLVTFTWQLEGAESEVRIELTADPKVEHGPATSLQIRHHFPRAPQVRRARELIDDLWRLTCGNLQAYMRGGEGLLLPDFTDASPSIRLSILIDAPRERVFHALVDPDTLNRWVAAAAVVEPRVGGIYSFGWNYKVGDRDVAGGPTRILELVENEKLVIDWPDWRGDPGVRRTTVTWLLESVGDKTRVTMIHGVFERTADISDYPFGWLQFLGKLQEVLV